MKQYLDLQRHVLKNGTKKLDRTGTGTLSVFGYQMRFDLSEGFPLLTTKDMSGVRFKSIVRELLWFLAGETNIKPLTDNGVNIWNRDAYRDYRENGGIASYKEFVEMVKEEESPGWDLGPIYGYQWRTWERLGPHPDTIDQIAEVIESIKTNPDSRRHIVSAWNVADLQKMALPPCHVLFQFYVADGKLSLQLYQRSGDVFLGVPFNIASYSLLLHMMAKETGLEVGEFIHTIGDAHIYLDHIEQSNLQQVREPKPLPQLVLRNERESIFDYQADDFYLVGYDPHPPIKARMST